MAIPTLICAWFLKPTSSYQLLLVPACCSLYPEEACDVVNVVDLFEGNYSEILNLCPSECPSPASWLSNGFSCFHLGCLDESCTLLLIQAVPVISSFNRDLVSLSSALLLSVSLPSCLIHLKIFGQCSPYQHKRFVRW